ncbi:MAG: 3-phosphoglycerate dehydrogenase [Clostridium sp. SCN 57-10]|nr:MAG: 3-phosphoglycerate dehydrogenase [Clostridium sp. SCN 57-10]
MIRVLAADGMEASAVAALEAKGFEVVQKFYEPEELAEKVKEFDALVVRSATKVRKPIVDAAVAGGRLRLVLRGGVGVDNIDVEYAEQNGIKVSNTPRASSASVAELALGHMFAMARYISIANVTMRNGEWNKKHYEGIELGGKTLGLIGMGRISQEIAKRAVALGMKVVYTDIFEIPGLPAEYTSMSREEVLKNADFVSLHIPMPADKKPVITANELALMKPTAFIVNTARGGLICEEALCDALDADKLAGAALDVFAEEPTKNERLLKHPKVSVTPHIGGSTKEAQGRIGEELVELLTKFFA